MCEMENVLVRPSESPTNFEALASASIPNAPLYNLQNQSFSGFGNLNSRSTFSPAVENDVPTGSKEDQEEVDESDDEVAEMEMGKKDTIEVDEDSLDVEFEHFDESDKNFPSIEPQCNIKTDVHTKETRNDEGSKESISLGTDAIANRVEQIQPLQNGITDESSRIDSPEKQDDEDVSIFTLQFQVGPCNIALNSYLRISLVHNLFQLPTVGFINELA